MNINTNIQDRMKLAVALYTGDMGALMADIEQGIYDPYQVVSVYLPPLFTFTVEPPAGRSDPCVRDIDGEVYDIQPLHLLLGTQEYVLWHDPADNRIFWTEGRSFRERPDSARRIGIYK